MQRLRHVLAAALAGFVTAGSPNTSSADTTTVSAPDAAPALRVHSIISDDEALMIDENRGKYVVVRPGDTIAGWRIRTVMPNRVVVEGKQSGEYFVFPVRNNAQLEAAKRRRSDEIRRLADEIKATLGPPEPGPRIPPSKAPKGPVASRPAPGEMLQPLFGAPRTVKAPKQSRTQPAPVDPYAKAKASGPVDPYAKSKPSVPVDPYAKSKPSGPVDPYAKARSKGGATLDPYAKAQPRSPLAPYAKGKPATLDPYAKIPTVKAPARKPLVDPYAKIPTVKAPVKAGPVDPYSAPAGKKPVVVPPTVVRTPASPIQVRRSEFNATITNLPALEKSAEIERASGGGFRLRRLNPSSYFYRLGLRPGDVVRKVAGIAINSVDDAASIYAGLLSTREFQVDIVRGGRNQALRFRFDK